MTPEEWQQIVELSNDGVSVTGIATKLAMSRNTVRRALTFDAPPDDHRPRNGSRADALEPAIRSLLATDPDLTVAQLHRELQWDGSRNTFARVVRRVRGDHVVRRRNQGGAAGLLPPSEIPQFATSFIGRTEELRGLRALLGDNRLVTITGPGGIGKTRLAAEAAGQFRRAFSDGVLFIELASIRQDSLVLQAILDALGIDEPDVPGRGELETLIGAVRHKQILLVLDNCEHVIAACAALISKLIRSSKDLKVLVTSREVLSVPGEHVSVLEPLSTTDTTDPSRNGAAIELFESRASAAIAGFALTAESRDVVRRVCIQLDGMPLAIELACARLTALSVEDLSARLNDRLSLLTMGNRGGPDRHRSLQSTVEWSYDLCTRDEQILWARLSIFAEGFDLATAEAVCASEPLEAPQILDTLAGLVSKSVLQRDNTTSSIRFRMLETIRHFGASKLSSEEADRLQQAHLRWSGALVSVAQQSWTGNAQERISSQLRENRANLRLALQNALTCEYSDSVDLAAGLIATWFLWSSAFSIREHRMWITRFLQLPLVSEARRAQLSATLGVLQTMQGERQEARDILDSTETRAKALHDDATLAFALQTQGLNTYLGGDFVAGEEKLTEALRLYESLPQRTDLMWTAHVEMGMLLSSDGETDRAAEHFEFVRNQASATGERWMLSYAIYGLGLVALGREQYHEAAQFAIESLRLKRAFEDTVGTTLVIDLLAWAEAASGSGERAAVFLGAASTMWDSFGMQLYGSQHWVERHATYELRARNLLGDNAYQDASRRGATMSPAEITAFALDEETQRRTASPEPEHVLSAREQDIAGYIAEGLSNKEIATLMVLSVRTVEGHVSNLLRKLGVSRRQQVPTALVR